MKAKPTPVSDAVGISVDITVPGMVASSSAPERSWRHHVGVAAELIVREEVDRDLAAGLGGDRLDGFLQPHVDRVRDRQVVAELQLQRRGLRQDGGALQQRSGGDSTSSGSQKRTTANREHWHPPM